MVCHGYAVLTRAKETEARMGAEIARLPPRQREVLGLVADGLTNDEIAVKLGIEVPTVNAHVGVLLLKFRGQAVRGGLR